MEKDDFKTKVLFRVFKGNNGFKYWKGDVIALFPEQIDGYQIGSYMHVGQHSPCDYNFMIQSTRQAKETEYKCLKNELENYMGYDLRIMKRCAPKYK
jgi:hypothetical protein